MVQSMNPAGAAIGALGNIGAALASNAVSYSSNKKLMKLQAALNYYYAHKTAINQPSWNRQGLEGAGYNPMLAVQNATSGANSNWSGLNSVENPGLSDALSAGIANAQSFKRLENETKQTDSTVHLQEEQAETEQAKRENLSFQNAKLDVEKNLKDKDLSTYDERFNTEMYNMMQQAEKYRQEASVVNYNAESQRMMAQAAQTSASAQDTEAQTHKEQLEGSVDKFMANYAKNHPHLYGIYRHLDNTLGLAGRVLGGAGTLSSIYNANRVSETYNTTDFYDSKGNHKSRSVKRSIRN